MIPYVIVFLIIIIFSVFSEQCFVKNKKKSGFFCLAVVILVLSLFAGLRTVSLGYDTKAYVLTTYNYISSGRSLMEIFNVYGMEKGFITYMYLAYQLNSNFNFILFCLNLPVNIAFVIFAYHFKKGKSIPIMMTIYYCTLYAFSFNIVRQSLSLSLFLLMLFFVDKKRYVLSIVTFVIGGYFHNSMLFAALAIIINVFSENNKIKQRDKVIAYILTIVVMVLVLIFYENIIQFAYNIGFINERYLYYINRESFNYRTVVNVEYSLLFLKTSALVFVILFFNANSVLKEDKIKYQKWFIMLIIDYIFTFLSFKLANIDRISWYLYYPAIFMVAPELVKVFKNDKKNRALGNLIIVSIFVLYLLEKLITNQYRICPYEWIF